MDKKLNIIITGASSGIGRSFTEELIKEGHQLFLIARRQDRLNEITQNNNIAFGYSGDVSKVENVQDFIKQIQQKTNHIDVLINNAGIFGAIGSISDVDCSNWVNTIEVNLIGPYYMTKYTLPLLQNSQDPRIINISGGGAFNPFPNYSAYAVSKAGLVRLTENLAVELKKYGIAVNGLAPGFVKTELHNQTLESGIELAGEEHYNMTVNKLKEGSLPMEIPIKALKYLISEQSKGLTGKTFSASFDPWHIDEFSKNIEELNASELYTMTRININHLKENQFKHKINEIQQTGQSKPKI